MKQEEFQFPHPGLPLPEKGVIDSRYLENIYALHLSFLKNEGISDIKEWLKRCGEFSSHLKERGEALYSELIDISKQYKAGQADLDKYVNKVQDWTIFCLMTNDKLKAIKWT